MKPIPNTENALVLRTDFSNQAAWEAIRSKIQKPVGLLRFRANLEFLDDPAYAGITKNDLLGLIPENYDHTFIVVVDQTAVTRPGNPLLVVDLVEKSGNEFRADPTMLQSIENNLSIANMDFEEFAGHVDPDGVFRGFPRG